MAANVLGHGMPPMRRAVLRLQSQMKKLPSEATAVTRENYRRKLKIVLLIVLSFAAMC